MYFEKTTKPFIDIKGGNFLIKIAKAGVLPYIENGEVIYKYKSKEELFSQETLEKAINIPITIDHPQEKLVSLENRGWLQAGVVSNLREGDGELAGYLIGDATITDERTLNDIINHKLVEVSVGIIMEEFDEAGTFEGKNYSKTIKNIQINHVALLGENEARGGSDLKVILDKKNDSKIENDNDNKDNDKKEKEEVKMIKVKVDDNETIEVDEKTAGVIDSLKKENEKLQLKIVNDSKDLKIKDLEAQLNEAKNEAEELKSKQKIENDSKKDIRDIEDAKKILGEDVEGLESANDFRKKAILKVGLDSKDSDTQEIIDAKFGASKILFSQLNRDKDGTNLKTETDSKDASFLNYQTIVRI